MKTIHYTFDTHILIKITVKYVKKKFRKRLEIDQFDNESINQSNKKFSNKKFNAENQFN